MPRKHVVKSWSFPWICPNCDTIREFLVNEIVGTQLPVLARCRCCTRLLTVTDKHRQAVADIKEPG